MDHPVPLDVAATPGEPAALADALTAAARRVAAAVPAAVVSTSAPGASPHPSLTLRAADGRTVCYLAAPDGPEAAPFDELAAALARPASAPPAAAAELTVFIAAGCPHCPGAVRAAAALACAAPGRRLTVVDAALFPALAARWNARSVPLTVLDDELALTGVRPAAELAAALAARGTPEHERRVLAALTAHGRFAAAGERLARPSALAAFAELWGGAALERRIGLLLAVESAPPGGAWRARLAAAVEPAVGAGDARLRGDTAELLVRLGGAAAAALLARLAADPDPDVADAARDGLEELGAG